jgi:hypothetical protein
VSLTGALSVQDNNYLKQILVGDKRKLSRNKHRANSNTEKAQEEEKHVQPPSYPRDTKLCRIIEIGTNSGKIMYLILHRKKSFVFKANYGD